MKCSLFINNYQYSLTQFSELSLEKNEHWALPAQVFIRRWLNGQSHFPIETSGSTGTPKTIELTRSQIEASAKSTIKALQLNGPVNALVCINTAYIGGQMMLARAILGCWNVTLIEPTMNFEKEELNKTYDFTAMVPLQVLALSKSELGMKFLNNTSKIIVGGAPVSDALISILQPLKSSFYHTYGMTETVSHIGLKALNGDDKSDWFEIIGDNEIKTDNRGCMTIKGSVTNDEWVLTNDITQIEGKKFKWLGRADLVINSGGVKLFIEKIENQLNQLLPVELQGTFLIWKKPHDTLGEQLIALSPNTELLDYVNIQRLKLKQLLPNYNMPKEWIRVSSFSYTQSGKFDRQGTLNNVID